MMDILQSNDLVTSTQETETEESDKPPSNRPRGAVGRVAVIANVKGESKPDTHTAEDAGAEFDKPETIQAIQAAIESANIYNTIYQC